ncbi:MAG: MarR family transcriptional regulator [Cyclobacteriaceae bacterium]
MKENQPLDIVGKMNRSPRLQIIRASGRFHKAMIALTNKKIKEAGHDLSLEHAIILKNLLQKDGQSQQELADNIIKHKSSVTFLIDNMVKRNLVVRVPDQIDKRGKLIYLTELGRGLLNKVFPILFEQMHKVTENVDEKDLHLCISILEKLQENTKAIHESE